jgi:uncharacterized membrane protein YgcG
MQGQNLGVWVAMAAILVQAPRVVLAVLEADRQPMGADWQRRLLVLAGCGTAVVLTGGNLYLVHTLVRARRWRRLLLVTWLVVLGSTCLLVVPLIVAGINGERITQVLAPHAVTWIWAVVAALSHEVTAAGCVLSAGALKETAEAEARERSESVAVAELLSQRDAARREAELLREQVRQSVPGVRLVVPLSLEGSGRESGSRGDGSGGSGGSGSGGSGSGGSGSTERATVANDSAAAGSAADGAAERAAGGRAEVVSCREGCGREFGSQLAEMGHYVELYIMTLMWSTGLCEVARSSNGLALS